MRPLVAGNWKMNGLASSLGELAALKDALAGQAPARDVLVCPPATLIAQAAWLVKGATATPSGARERLGIKFGLEGIRALVLADDEGPRSIGTTAAVTDATTDPYALAREAAARHAVRSTTRARTLS